MVLAGTNNQGTLRISTKANVRILELNFERASVQNLKYHFTDQLDALKKHCVAKRQQWARLMDIVARRNPSLILQTPTQFNPAVSNTWSGEYSLLSESFAKNCDTRSIPTLFPLLQRVLDAESTVNSSLISIRLILAAFYLSEQPLHQTPTHYQMIIIVGENISTASFYESTPFQLSNCFEILHMEQRYLTNGEKSLTQIIDQLIHLGIRTDEYDQDLQPQLPYYLPKNAPPLRRHRFVLDQKGPGILTLKLIHDLGFRDLELFSCEATLMDEQRQLAWLQYEYQSMAVRFVFL
jgi:hypothetical protein